jgi:uncharacterized protein with PQ loop repeat
MLLIFFQHFLTFLYIQVSAVFACLTFHICMSLSCYIVHVLAFLIAYLNMLKSKSFKNFPFCPFYMFSLACNLVLFFNIFVEPFETTQILLIVENIHCLILCVHTTNLQKLKSNIDSLPHIL